MKRVEKQRARSRQDKAARRNLILNTAEKLYLEDPSGLPSIGQIAQESGLARGTFYLYFKTKESIFLEILQRKYEIWFNFVSPTIKEKSKINNFEELFQVLFAPIVQDKIFLNLGCITQTIIEENISEDRMLQFKNFLGKNLLNLSTALAKALDKSTKETLTNLLHTYSAIMGLWQTCKISKNFETIKDKVEYQFMFQSFDKEVKQYISKFWII